MKILFVCSSRARSEGYFTSEQADDLRRDGHSVEFFYILKRGLWGYLISWIPLIIKIISVKPDIVHAHYGLSGFVAVLQPFKPVVLTVHGGDINEPRNARITRIACCIARHVIIVNEDMREKIRKKTRISLLPCAANTRLFSPLDRIEARHELGMDTEEPIVLFASGFDKKVKNVKLANQAISLSGLHPRFIEAYNWPRDKMPFLINAADLLLTTSYYEGSPQIVKEAMACNIPVVSTDVGDIKKNFGNIEGCFITGFDPTEIAFAIDKAINFRRSGMSTNGRDRLFVLGLDPETITAKLTGIYSSLHRRKKEA